jgi:allophanate hydrolase subunit 2
MQKNVVYMHISADSKLPFGCVWGTVQNAAPGYPVVIQIYKDGKPVYFAQTNVKSDGSYENYFRVKSIDDGKVNNIFEGDYKVEVFKTVLKTSTASATTQT